MENQPIYSHRFTNESKSLVESLLKSNDQERLGMKSFNDLKKHSYF
jgi:hypothetical protein